MLRAFLHCGQQFFIGLLYFYTAGKKGKKKAGIESRRMLADFTLWASISYLHNLER
jgi:hypothetical protein